jgi:hypothetical protein
MRLYRAGFELSFPTAPITVLSGTWTVPDLNHSATPETFPNHLHTFFGLGFLDVHVAVAVDVEQNVTTSIQIHTGAQVALQFALAIPQRLTDFAFKVIYRGS